MSNAPCNSRLNKPFKVSAMKKKNAVAHPPPSGLPFSVLLSLAGERGWVHRGGEKRDGEINKSELARRFDVKPGAIGNWMNRGYVPLRSLSAVAAALGISRPKLLELADAKRTATEVATERHLPAIGSASQRVPVIGTAHIGRDGAWNQLLDAGGSIKVHSAGRGAYALQIIGDSLQPWIKSGDYVVIEPSLPYEAGDDVHLRTRDGRSIICEFIYRRDGLVAVNTIGHSQERLTFAEAEIEHIHRILTRTGRENFERG